MGTRHRGLKILAREVSKKKTEGGLVARTVSGLKYMCGMLRAEKTAV